MSEQTVSINGTVYDKRTGMPVRVERTVHNTTRKSATSVHQQPQHSRTLNRKYVKRDPSAPAAGPTTTKQQVVARKVAPKAPQQVSRSESISRFAKQYNNAHKPSSQVITDFGPAPHALQRTAHARMAAKSPATTVIKPSHVIKNEAIEKAMASLPDKRSSKQVRQQRHQSKTRRAVSMASGALAIILLGGYFTYLNMPQLSTRVAAAQAGINATYPNYQPSGYSLSGPVAYDQGSVSMKFAANAAPQSYTLSQTRSGWDSSALLDNLVRPEAGDAYATTTINGLTIYTYGDNAAWVNGGILYNIAGNAMLSNDQVERIATSL